MKNARASRCGPKPAVEARPLISLQQGGQLASLFKVLASDTRLRLLHALVRSRELCLTELAEEVSMSPQSVSNQLQRLVAQGILGAQRNGNNVHYRIVDPCVVNLLDQGLCLLEDSGARRP